VSLARRLSRWFHAVSTGWVTLAALIVFLIFTATVLPSQAAQADAATGGAPSPDTSLIYTPQELYAMAEAYGATGRAAYIRARFTFDLVWPVIYLAFLVTAISWLSRQVFEPERAWAQLNLIPVIGVGLDYLENITAAWVMGRYPARTPIIDVLAPMFTFLKWVFVGGSFVVLTIVLGLALRRAVARRARQ